MVVQLGWGALFCLPMGFSFTALRLSTLTLGLVGIAGQYGLLRQLGADRRIATFGAALLAFNPFYINLSYSFMTDIPFLALMIVSMLLLIRGLDLNRNREIFAGLLLAVMAMFIRQIGLMILIGFVVAYPLRRGFDRRWFLLALVPTALAIALLSLSEIVLKQLGELPGRYHAKSDDMMAVLSDIVHLRLGAVRRPLRGIMLLLMYVGQWCLPLCVLVVPTVLGRLTPLVRSLALVWIAGFTVGVGSLLAFIGWLMPMTDNMLIDFGLGVRSLPGDLPHAPVFLWVVVTALAALGGARIAGDGRTVSRTVAWRPCHRRRPKGVALACCVLFSDSHPRFRADGFLICLLVRSLSSGFPAADSGAPGCAWGSPDGQSRAPGVLGLRCLC